MAFFYRPKSAQTLTRSTLRVVNPRANNGDKTRMRLKVALLILLATFFAKARKSGASQDDSQQARVRLRVRASRSVHRSPATPTTRVPGNPIESVEVFEGTETKRRVRVYF